jgi:hypothetical protein
MLFPQFAQNPGVNIRTNITTSGQMPSMGAENTASASNGPQRRAHARFEFVMPDENVNEQFDLYG